MLNPLKTILFFLLFISVLACSAQDTASVRRSHELTSPGLWGRGYTNNGMQKAAQYIANELQLMGVSPVRADKGYFQEFTMSVNTFPGKMQVRVNGKKLTPGADFIVVPQSKAIKGNMRLVPAADSNVYINYNKKTTVELVKKLTWSVATTQADFSGIEILNTKVQNPSRLKINIQNNYQQQFTAQNVMGQVKGTVFPDSCIVITAHYDHLGGMGKTTYFPGANDNASGVALLLRLAAYYAKNPAPYTLVFIAFAAEEAGLIGSKYYTEHPVFPLSKIKFLLNTDLAGTGSEGITVVNATSHEQQFKWLQQINEKYKLLKTVNARNNAANSDHYWFTQKGVPAFFFYTMGGITAYHDIYDKAETLPMDRQDQLMKLVTEFVNYFSGNTK